MKSEKTIQVDHRMAWNMDGWPHRVVSRLAMWNYDVQTIGGAALENNDQPLFPVSHQFGPDSGTGEERRNRRGAHDGPGAIAKESATSDRHGVAATVKI